MWEQIRANQRRSFLLTIGMMLTLAAFGFSVGFIWVGNELGGVLGLIGAMIVFLLQMCAYWFAAETILMSGLNARELSREDCPRLFNIVEEMKLASGLETIPRIYLVDSHAPNAFAIGRKPENSAIAVTTGLLYRLNRDELQGVVAHEIGHLRNHDVEFMTRAAVILGTIIILQEMLWQSMRFGAGRSSGRSSSRGGNGNAQLVFLVIALVVAVVGPIVARLLYYACSRSREYLADASAVQFTRYPEGLASALEKIARADTGLVVSKAVAPMFIINPLRKLDAEAQSMFSTHPSTDERIRILRTMAGAGVTDYDRAFREARGKGLIGQQTLAQASPVAAREASSEGAIETRQEVNATINRLHGYLEVNCDCGMRMSIPEGYEGDEVVCIRCGAKMAIPSARERYKEIYDVGKEKKPVETGPLAYERKGTGWEVFRCPCGGSVQLSPGFSAPRTFCPKCRRQIDVSHAA